MSLTKLLTNHCPKFETEIPSTKQRIWYRPFLVKEEKKLLMVQEFGTEREIINCMVEILEDCYDSTIFRGLPLFDIEFLFVQLRINSIGSSVDTILTCPITQEKINLKIDLADIDVIYNEKHNKSIDIGNKIIINMKYPTVGSLLNSTKRISEESIYDIALSCIESIQTETELIDCSTQSKNEVEDFLNHMSPAQFSKITEFFDTTPKLEKILNYTTSDGTTRMVTLKGIKDFFV